MEARMQLLRAVEDKGPLPAHHDWTEARHRQEWPALWGAIDRVIEEYKIELLRR